MWVIWVVNSNSPVGMSFPIANAFRIHSEPSSRIQHGLSLLESMRTLNRYLKLPVSHCAGAAHLSAQFAWPYMLEKLQHDAMKFCHRVSNRHQDSSVMRSKKSGGRK